MTRLLYGGTGGDLLATIGTDGDYRPTTDSFTAYPTFTGGAPITDLQTAAGVAASTVTPTGNRIIFYGPDAYTGPMWLQDVNDATAPRWLVNPTDLATRAGGSGSTAYGADPYGSGAYGQ